MKSFMFYFFVKYSWEDQVKEDEMSDACSTHGRDEKIHTKFHP